MRRAIITSLARNPTFCRVFWQTGDISASSSSAMHRAFVDLWLLGETASIVTTCGSTFGYVAHARSNLKPIVITLDTAEAIHINTSEPCMHTWPFLLELKCFRGNFHTAMAQFGHLHCRPWDMCVLNAAFVLENMFVFKFCVILSQGVVSVQLTIPQNDFLE